MGKSSPYLSRKIYFTCCRRLAFCDSGMCAVPPAGRDGGFICGQRESHDEADEENAVRGFNRTNTEFQIEVRDYMDYSAGFDQDAAVARFVEEAGAGNVSDLFPPLRVDFPCHTQSMAASNCLDWRKNLSPLGIPPFIKQDLRYKRKARRTFLGRRRQ